GASPLAAKSSLDSPGELEELSNPPASADAAEEHEEQKTVKGIFEDLLSKVWPFRKEKEEEQADSVSAPATEPQAEEISLETAEEEPLDYQDVPDTGTAVKSLLMEIETGGLERSIADLKKESAAA